MRMVPCPRAEYALLRLDALLKRATLGLHLTVPWTVALVGLPNVGKSSLLNALAGYERAIVFDQPGTTRDVVTLRTALDGWPVELADTAGQRSSGDPLETAGATLAAEHADRADFVLLVTDASHAWTALEQAMLQRWPRALVVHNKTDLPETDDARRPSGQRVSAKSGLRLDELTAAIVARLVPDVPPPGVAVPFTDSHVRTLRCVYDATTRGDVVAACEQLQGLLNTG